MTSRAIRPVPIGKLLQAQLTNMTEVAIKSAHIKHPAKELIPTTNQATKQALTEQAEAPLIVTINLGIKQARTNLVATEQTHMIRAAIKLAPIKKIPQVE